MNKLLTFFFLFISVHTNVYAQAGLSRRAETVPSFRCTGMVHPHKGASHALRNKGGVQVEAFFYAEADTFMRYAMTDTDGRFEMLVPSGCTGRVKVGFNTYRNGKSMGYLVELDREDGRRAADGISAEYVCIQDSAGHDIYVYDMQRESELCLLRGGKIDYMPKWLVGQQPVKDAYYKERRAIAWSCNRLSLYKCPLFKLSLYNESTGYRVMKYHYNLLEERNTINGVQSGILELGGPRVWMNNIDKLYVSTARFPVSCIFISPEDDKQIRMQLQKNIAPYNPIGVYYNKTLPMVYIEDKTFYTYLDIPS